MELFHHTPKLESFLSAQSNSYIHIKCLFVNVIIPLAHPTCNSRDFKDYDLGEVLSELGKKIQVSKTAFKITYRTLRSFLLLVR